VIEEQIDVGIFTRFVSRRRAEQIKALDAERFQLGLVRLQAGHGVGAVHDGRDSTARGRIP
jgi:hypothetical protein